MEQNTNKVMVSGHLSLAKGQHLEVVISLHSDYIKSDRQFLERAWENLLYNAVEHTPYGGNIIISIENKLYFQIEDSGDGFTEEDICHGSA